MMDSNYGNIIWTNHALARMRDRGIKQSDAWVVWRNPQKTKYAKTKSAWVYRKIINGQKIGVVARKNDKGKWVILSVWSKPVFIKETEKRKSLFSCIFKFFRYNKRS